MMELDRPGEQRSALEQNPLNQGYGVVCRYLFLLEKKGRFGRERPRGSHSRGMRSACYRPQLLAQARHQGKQIVVLPAILDAGPCPRWINVEIHNWKAAMGGS